MTIISILGVTAGVSILIVVLSVMGGFENSLQEKMLRGEPHLELFGKNAAAGYSLADVGGLAGLKKDVPEAVTMEAFTKSDVVLKHRKHLQSTELIGIDPTRDNHLWIFADSMTEGSLSALSRLHEPVVSEQKGSHKWPGIIMGENLAGSLGVDIGDEILVVNPAAAVDSSTVLSGGTTTRPYVLVGTFRTFDSKFDSKLSVVSLAEGRRFMTAYEPYMQDAQFVSGIAINLENPYEVDEIESRLSSYQNINPVSWKKSNSSLLFALKLEKFAMGSILMLIVVVAAFSISGTMMMTVFHKKTQVSLLRAIGMTRGDIGKLYALHGFTIGTVGIVLGLGVGLLLCFIVDNFDIISLPQGVYNQVKLPVKYLPGTYVVVCLSAWVFSLVASAYPALTAAMQHPSSGLRYE